MILIADSGSTKTDWLAISSHETSIQINTKGLNPFYNTPDSVVEALNDSEIKNLKDNIEEVHFYGAGCLPGKPSEMLENVFETYFKNCTHITIGSDMLGAARALCGTEAGIACILGTGANTCLYNGTEIIDQVPAMGFILGDEGSGGVLGRKLLTNIFKRNMPVDITTKFFEKYKTELSDVIDAVYKQPYPSKYLAQYTVFLKENINNVSIQKLVYDSFIEFIEFNLEKYKDYTSYKINFAGSIAFHFENVLTEALKSKKLSIGKIIQKPIDELANQLINNK